MVWYCYLKGRLRSRRATRAAGPKAHEERARQNSAELGAGGRKERPGKVRRKLMAAHPGHGAKAAEAAISSRASLAKSAAAAAPGGAFLEEVRTFFGW